MPNFSLQVGQVCTEDRQCGTGLECYAGLCETISGHAKWEECYTFGSVCANGNCTCDPYLGSFICMSDDIYFPKCQQQDQVEIQIVIVRTCKIV